MPLVFSATFHRPVHGAVMLQAYDVCPSVHAVCL